MPRPRTRSPRNRDLAAFGDSVVWFRRRAGLSQEALADLADIHPTALGRIERGQRNVTYGTVGRLADALGVRRSDLVLRAEEFDALREGDR